MGICDLCQLSSPAIGCTRLSGEACLKEALKWVKATATNGDIIKALFPSLDNSATYDDGVVRIFNPSDKVADIATNTDWLYRRYKEGDTE